MRMRGIAGGWRWLCIVASLVAISLTSAAAAGEYKTVDVEGLRITIDTEWGLRTAPGYYPVRFDIANSGEARVIEILGSGTRYSRSARGFAPGTITIQQPVRLARGDRVRLTIPVPVFADNENLRFEIREDGRVLERFSYFGFQSRVGAPNASALIIADGTTELGKRAPSWARRVSAPSGMVSSGRATPLIDFVLEPSRVPTNWLGYTTLRAVFLGPAEWQLLTDDQKQALLTWTACGGDLILLNGTLNTLIPGSQEPPPERPARAHFFGRIHLVSSSSLDSGGVGPVLASTQKLQDSNWALPANTAKDWSTITARGFRLPIPGIEGVPARTYLAILLVFSFIVGPVNYWFLRRKGRQVLLVLTAPLISLVFIVLLGAYVLAGEGIGVRGRAVSFTMLDEVRKQASTRSSISLYAAGMAPRGGLRFPRDMAIVALGRDGNGPRENVSLDLSESQRFTAGLVQARAPSNLEQAGFRPARERLAVNRQDGSLRVTNGLGATIVTLLYRDNSGTYHLTRALPVGSTETLTSGRLEAVKILPTDLPISGRLLYLVENQPVGSYIAILDRSPFWEPGVDGITEYESLHVVLGWPNGQ